MSELADIANGFRDPVVIGQDFHDVGDRRPYPPYLAEDLHLYDDDRRNEQLRSAKERSNTTEPPLFPRGQPKRDVSIEVKIHRSVPSLHGQST